MTPTEAAEAIARGWAEARPGDVIVVQPLSDGGEGLLEVLGGGPSTRREVEVSGPLGLPVAAAWSLDGDEAVIESARACGLALVSEAQRDPLRTTSWGVGELLDVARAAGASRMLVGLGGSATVDGGAGAVAALGARTLVADGSGLKVGGQDLPRVRSVERGWMADWRDIEVVLLADVTTPLPHAAATFGPQKGAAPAAVAHLERGLESWADAVEQAFQAPGLRDVPGSGAAGGLAFGLAAATGGRIVAGAARVADRVCLDELVCDADLVVTGEGRLDATSVSGKAVSEVVGRAARVGVPVVAVCGQLAGTVPGLADVEAAAPDGPGDDPAEDVATATKRLAMRVPSP